MFLFILGLSRSPTPRQLERALDELNSKRAQCPVGLHTLIVPRKNSQNVAPEAQPMVYLKCGHVQVCKHSFFPKIVYGQPISYQKIYKITAVLMEFYDRIYQ